MAILITRCLFFPRNLFPSFSHVYNACFLQNRSRLTWAVHYMSANKNLVRRDACCFTKWEELSPATDRLYLDAICTFYRVPVDLSVAMAILSHQKPWLLIYVCFPSSQDWSWFNECTHFV